MSSTAYCHCSKKKGSAIGSIYFCFLPALLFYHSADSRIVLDLVARLSPTGTCVRIFGMLCGVEIVYSRDVQRSNPAIILFATKMAGEPFSSNQAFHILWLTFILVAIVAGQFHSKPAIR